MLTDGERVVFGDCGACFHDNTGRCTVVDSSEKEPRRNREVGDFATALELDPAERAALGLEKAPARGAACRSLLEVL